MIWVVKEYDKNNESGTLVMTAYAFLSHQGNWNGTFKYIISTVKHTNIHYN